MTGTRRKSATPVKSREARDESGVHKDHPPTKHTKHTSATSTKGTTTTTSAPPGLIRVCPSVVWTVEAAVMMWGKALLCSALLLLLVSVTHAQDESLEAYDGQKNCYITAVPPETPRALSFCNRYNSKACCVPGIDADNHELFSTLTDVGLSCRLRGDIRDHPLARLYCLNCDPNQPRYRRPIAYTSPNGEITRPETILICQDWAEKQFGDLSRFNECGLLISSACVGENGTEIDGRDRYVCGDDIVIPRNEKDDSLNDLQNVEQFLNFPSLGTPEMDGDFGFKLVRNEICNDEEAMMLNPPCLRSAAQMERNRTLYASANVTECADVTYYNNHPDECVPLQAEMCFSSGSSSASVAVASAMTLFMALLVATLA